MVLHVDDKIATYLASGTQLAITVDPRARKVELHDRGGAPVVLRGQLLQHPALPDFKLSVTELFEVIGPPA